jgi:alkylation response protein AidB-like acyl-CoA dehydrogenase
MQATDRSVFRQELRQWLAANVPSQPLPSVNTAEGFSLHREWERRLFAAGLAVVTWPEEYGGARRDGLDWLAFEEEYWAANAPVRVSQNGIFLLAPAIFEFGTPDQKARFLLPMARADEVWAQGWSEPEAGSDLAALRSRADRADGGWRLNGRKTWCTRGSFADWLFGLFRTDPRSTRHRGLTYLLVPLDAAGVRVHPIRQLGGDPGFAEIEFDDVFVPEDQVLGEVGDGWRVAMSTISSERGHTLRSPGRFLAAADQLVRLWQVTQHADGRLRADVVQSWMDAQAYRLFAQRTAANLLSGKPVGVEASANKIFWSELDLRVHETALSLLGERAIEPGPWFSGYEFALAGPIYAGSNEIQRNILAERVLGLPRES